MELEIIYMNDGWLIFDEIWKGFLLSALTGGACGTAINCAKYHTSSVRMHIIVYIASFQLFYGSEIPIYLNQF